MKPPVIKSPQPLKLVLLGVALAAVLSACSSGTTTPPDPQPPSTDSPGVWDSSNWDSAVFQ